MSPEQATGKSTIDQRADIYALGSVLFEMIAGTPPFAGATAADVIAQRAERNAPSLKAMRRDIPERLGTIVARSLERDPTARQQSVGEFADSMRQSRRPPRATRRAIAAAGIIITILAGTAYAISLLRPDSPEGLRHRTTLEATELYERGRDQLDRSVDPQGLRRAIDYFAAAIVADSLYAEAHAGLSAAYGLVGTGNANDADVRIAFDSARTSALRAIALDSSLPEGYAALGMVRMLYDLDWDGAEKAFARARDLNPFYDRLSIYPAALYQWQGQFDRAVQESRDIVKSEPFSVSSRTELGRALFFAGDYPAALAELDSAYRRDSSFARIHLTRGEIYAKQKRFPEAIAEFERLARATPRSAAPIAFLAFTHGAAGQRAKAQEYLDTLLVRSRDHRAGALYVAIAYAGMTNYDEAFRWLDRSRADHSIRPLIMDPTFEDLRKDPRFATLARTLGLRWPPLTER